MAFVLKDRVKETTTTTGTGAVSLGGAESAFKAFQDYMSNGDTTYYAIVTKVSNTDEWEIGLGTWNTGNTLTRTTIISSSNSNAAVDFSAGDKEVFMTYPATKAVYTDSGSDVTLPDALTVTSDLNVGTHIDLAVQSAHASYQEGRMWYDSIHKTINFYSDDQNVIHEIGLEEHQRVYNNTGATISKGKPLYFSGNYTAGTLDVPTVGLANATDVNKYNAQGLAASDIPNNSYGYCIIAGQLDGVDTSGLNAGTNFFVGLTDGAVQNASPVYPNFPMCLGWVVNSDANDGILLVNQQNHSVNSFRVRTDAHIGDDLIVGGNLTVQGSTTTASSANVQLGASFQYLNAGDTIGTSGTDSSGVTGLDDATFTGHFTGTTPTTYYVKIDSVGTPDTFAVSTDNFATTLSTGNAITGNSQSIHSADNISVQFGATTGHTLNDVWTGTASPAAVDTGFFSNRNTGASGVGYTHMGIFYDVSQDKWILLDEYDPEPEGSIDLSDASVSYATLVAGTFEGDLTGDVTGNASTASLLETARTIGGVSFDGSANISLPGVDTAGTQNTTGSAATLTTARSISLTGDVSGSASFDGSADISITATVADDSHDHTNATTSADGFMSAADKTKLDGVETSADVTDATNVEAAGAAMDSDFTSEGLMKRGATAGSYSIITDNSGNWNTAYSWGDHASAGYLTAHPTITAASSSDNSGRTYIQDITLDSNGHVTGIATATETVTDTTYSNATTSASGLMSAADKTKLNGVETGADVTDTTNVTAAGALMDSELTNLAAVKAINQSLVTTAFPTFKGITATPTTLNGTGGTLTINLSSSNNFIINMSAATTFSFSNITAGRSGNIVIKQDATGGRTFTLPSQAKTPLNGASISQSTGANEISVLSYYVLDASNVLVNYIGDFA